MVSTNRRQMLAALLAVLALNPAQLSAFQQASRSPVAILGSVAAYGSVQVAGFPAPPESTLFADDHVSTGAGRAVIQYAQGARVLLANDSAAQFASEQVVLQRGQMTFRSASLEGPAYVAGTLRVEPLTAESAASIALSGAKAQVAVSEGSVRVTDSAAGQTVSMRSGETRDFEVVFPDASSAPAPPAAPQAPRNRGSGSAAYWLLGLGAGAAGGAVAARALSGRDVERAPELSPSRP